MQAFRDRSAEIEKLKGRVVAVSTDDAETLKSWRAELKAPQTFVADPGDQLVKLFDVKMAVLNVAQRHTFVIGPGRKILSHDEGSDAINVDGAIRACPLHGHAAAKPENPKDGG